MHGRVVHCRAGQWWHRLKALFPAERFRNGTHGGVRAVRRGSFSRWTASQIPTAVSQWYAWRCKGGEARQLFTSLGTTSQVPTAVLQWHALRSSATVGGMGEDWRWQHHSARWRRMCLEGSMNIAPEQVHACSPMFTCAFYSWCIVVSFIVGRGGGGTDRKL